LNKHAKDSVHSSQALRNSFEKRRSEYGGRVRVLTLFAEVTPFPEDNEAATS
jgi:hypothetical protein